MSAVDGLLQGAALVALVLAGSTVGAQGIDPGNVGARYAWAANAGWLNFRPASAGGQQPNVSDAQVTGFVWAENVGWINLSCTNRGTCGTVDYGVTNDGFGALAGLGWSENAGWISFSCTTRNTCNAVNYGVTIDKATGAFSGKAWGENVGWISFDPAPGYAGMVTGWRDTDGDGILDAQDNCTLVANASQCNSDGDAHGNRCDADLNNNGSTNAQDTVMFRQQLGQPSVAPGYNVADLNCNGAVNAQDTTLFRQRLGSPPGPAGLVP